MIVVGLVVSSDEPRLLSNGDFNTRASPFVIAIENAKISVLPGIYNGIILVTVLSVANTSVFASTRTLVSLAEHGKAPAVLAYIDNRGRPLVAFAVALTVGSLAYIVQASNVATIFNWLLAISGLSTIITWGSICLAHILFRKALQVQGHQLENLTWRTPFGVWGSWLALSMTCAVFIAQVVQAFVSISTDLNNLETMFANSNTTTTTTTNSTILNSSSSNTTTDNSIPLFLALLVFILSFVIWRILSSIDRQFYLDMDLDSGRWEGYHSHPPSLAEEADMEVGIQPDINLDGEVRDDRKWWFKAYEFLFH